MTRQVSRRLALGGGLPLVAGAVASCARARPSKPTSSDDPRSGPRSEAVGTPAPLTRTSGDVQVRVDGTAPRARREFYLTRAVAAIEPVEQTWGEGSLPAQVRLTAPATVAEFAELTGSRADVSALTRPDERVVLHPELWTRTSPDGREVVLRHELTHVALDQGDWGGAPRWVVEGSAEVTAYRRVQLPPRRIAPGLAERVRRGDGPTGPPTDGQVAADDGYGMAWAWCSFLIDQQGWSDFVRFVRDVSGDPTETGTARAFRATYDGSVDERARSYSTWLASWV